MAGMTRAPKVEARRVDRERVGILNFLGEGLDWKDDERAMDGCGSCRTGNQVMTGGK
jgi:hypothetical protein